MRSVKRRILLLGVALALVLLAAGGMGAFLWLRKTPLNPRVAEIDRAVSAQPAPSAAAASTVQEFAGNAPLGRLAVVADGLVNAHSVAQCAAAAASLGRLGSPTYLRGLAVAVPDGVAGDIAAGVVSASVSVLASCSTTANVTSQQLLDLRVATAGLSARLKVDRR